MGKRGKKGKAGGSKRDGGDNSGITNFRNFIVSTLVGRFLATKAFIDKLPAIRGV